MPLSFPALQMQMQMLLCARMQIGTELKNDAQVLKGESGIGASILGP